MPGSASLLPQQWPNEPVLVGDWQLDEDAPIHPGGQKPKRVFICPDTTHQPYLIHGHRYLFKEGDGFRAQQLWSEVIAYQLARATGTPVPPAFVAFDEKRGKPGVLIEFFFGRPGAFPPERFVHAIEMMQGAKIAVDPYHGSLRDNLRLCRLFGVSDRVAWWAETLAFDAVVGNTDRHTENWGFLRQTTEPSAPEFRLSPAFDNGSSLGWQIREAELGEFGHPGRLTRFIERGGHHYNWLAGDTGTASHADLCAKLVEVHPDARATMERVLQLRDSDIEDTLHWCTTFELDVRFTKARTEFVRRLLEARRAAITAAVGV